MIQKHAKLVRREHWRTNPVGMSDVQMMETFVRSGYFAQLDHAGRAVLSALLVFAERGRVTISYRGLQRYSGIVSRSAISKSLQQFAKDGLVEITLSKSGNFRTVSTYRFTSESQRFQSMLSQLHQNLMAEAESQRKLQEEYRSTLQPPSPSLPAAALPKSKPFVLPEDHLESTRSSERTAQLEEEAKEDTFADPGEMFSEGAAEPEPKTEPCPLCDGRQVVYKDVCNKREGVRRCECYKARTA